MPTVPERLRAGREALGLTVDEVADVTKIRTDHIRALEEGHYEAFAAPVYVRGFVRNYARMLRLDLDETAATLDAELRQNPAFQENLSLAGGHRGFLDVLMLQLSKVNWQVVLPTLVLAVLVLVSILGYRAWQERQSRDPLADLAPGLYQPAQGGDTLPLPVAPAE
jgi:cytoskeletal protein RodZ